MPQVRRLLPAMSLDWDSDSVKGGNFFTHSKIVTTPGITHSAAARDIWSNLSIEPVVDDDTSSIDNRRVDTGYEKYAVDMSGLGALKSAAGVATPTTTLNPYVWGYQGPKLECIPELNVLMLAQTTIFRNTTLTNQTGIKYGGDVFSQDGEGGSFAWVPEVSPGVDGTQTEFDRFIQVRPGYPISSATGATSTWIGMVDGEGDFTYSIRSQYTTNPVQAEGFCLYFMMSDVISDFDSSEYGTAGFTLFFGALANTTEHRLALSFPIHGSPTLSRLIYYTDEEEESHSSWRVVSGAPSGTMDSLEPGVVYSVTVKLVSTPGANVESTGTLQAPFGKYSLVISLRPVRGQDGGQTSPTNNQLPITWVYTPSGSLFTDQIWLAHIPETHPAFRITGGGTKLWFQIHGVENVYDSAWLGLPIQNSPAKLTADTLHPSIIWSQPQGCTTTAIVQDAITNLSDYAILPSGVGSWTLVDTQLVGTADHKLSPFIHRVEFRSDPSSQTYLVAPGSVKPTSDDIAGWSITATTEGYSSCNLTLWNTNLGGTSPSFETPGVGKFKYLSGVHYGALTAGWYTCGLDGTTFTNLYHRLASLRWCDPVFNLRSAAESSVSLTGVSNDVVLHDSVTINLPIYDGWCAILAILDVAGRCGFPPDQILAWQNPRDSNDQTRLDSYLTSDCAKGLCEHALPSAGWFENPIYMPQEGTPSWDVLSSFVQWLGAWMFVNNWGNLITTWPVGNVATSWLKYSSDATGLKLLDNLNLQMSPSSTLGAYNEIYDVQFTTDTKHIRNSITVIGLNWDQSNMVPLVQQENDWNSIYNGASPNFVAMKRQMLIQNPRLNTWDAVNKMLSVAALRYSRPRYLISFSMWGQPDIFPYDLVYIPDPTGRTIISDLAGNDPRGARFRVTSITHTFDAKSKSFTSQVQAEWADPYYLYLPEFF